MAKPWEGAARPLASDAFEEAGRRYGLEPAIIHAVWQVESAGRPYRRDGSVERRFEPHHMPGTGVTNWRDSLKVDTARREAMFAAAYARDPEAAMDATSWGGPQIMGFNAEAAGYSSARAMVEAMARDEAEHLTAFLRLINKWGLITVLAAHDWNRFAARYNGSGQAAVYGRKIETAYRALSGRASPVVLRLGRAGNAAAVRELQRALGIEDDGVFGTGTDRAVRAFQERYGLKVDGVVGARTWEMLRDRRGAAPKAQPTQGDLVGKVTAYSGAATAAAGAVAAVGDALSDTAMTIVASGATVAGVLAVGAFLLVKLRRDRVLT